MSSKQIYKFNFKVIFNKKRPDTKLSRQSFGKNFSETEVQVEDYQITRDGSIIDGASGKYYRLGGRPRSADKNCARERSSVNTVNALAAMQSVKDEDTYDCFGKYVASLLRKLNDQDAISLQGDIVNMIVDVHANIPPEEYI